MIQGVVYLNGEKPEKFMQKCTYTKNDQKYSKIGEFFIPLQRDM